jgi:hypothetical protein
MRCKAMKEREFALMHRDSITFGRVVAALIVLVALAGSVRTQARDAPTVGRTLPVAWARDPPKWVIDEISSVAGSSGKRCEMAPEEFAKFYPPLHDWIRNTLTANAHSAQTVASRGFSRLPLYFTEKTLASTKVVLADPLPIPPLSSMGLTRFADIERGNFDGITYLDTIFLKPTQSTNEKIHFHELVHVVQWRLLGPDRFLFTYANGLECFGYRHSPLEAMAHDAETAFAGSTAIFDAEKMVAEKLGL